MSGARPAAFIHFASFPTVVVFPVPLTPTTTMTNGEGVSDAGVWTSSRMARISDATRGPQRAGAVCLPHPGHDPVGRGEPHVGRDQESPQAHGIGSIEGVSSMRRGVDTRRNAVK